MYTWLSRSLPPFALSCCVLACGETYEPPRHARVAPPRPLPAIELSRPVLVAAARSGGDYLVRMQNEDGSFIYAYDAALDRASANESGAYNILRHAGTAFSLFGLYAHTKDARYLAAANRAVAYLKTRFRPVGESNAVYVLDDDGRAKLGASGLGLLAISLQLRLDPAAGDKIAGSQLASHIIGLQQPDGSFLSYHRLGGDEPEGDTSLYYPGEAILGLLEFYRLDPTESRLLDSARRGVDYLIASQRAMPALPPDAWLMQALEVLHSIQPDPKYV